MKKLKQLTTKHYITLSNLERLGNVARGYEITRLNGFNEHNGYKTFGYLLDLQAYGLVANHKISGKSIWFKLPATVMATQPKQTIPATEKAIFTVN